MMYAWTIAYGDISFRTFDCGFKLQLSKKDTDSGTHENFCHNVSSLAHRTSLHLKTINAAAIPLTGFEVIGSSCLVEEEKWEWYNPEEFYPVRIGEVFKSQYQVVGKQDP